MADSSPKGQKHRGKRRHYILQAISPFPTMFSKDLYCRHGKTNTCLGTVKCRKLILKFHNNLFGLGVSYYGSITLV